MNVNYKLSAELKKKYKHRIKQCYKNAFALFMKHKEIDYYVLGFVRDTQKNYAVRHCWGVKDGEIIDSTFGKDKKYISNTEYYRAFDITKDNISDVMDKTFNECLFGYDEISEYKVKDMLKEKYEGIKIYQ